MREAAIYILSVYALANAGIIYYFFVYKNGEADKKYDKQLREINSYRNQS